MKAEKIQKGKLFEREGSEALILTSYFNFSTGKKAAGLKSKKKEGTAAPCHKR